MALFPHRGTLLGPFARRVSIVRGLALLSYRQAPKCDAGIDMVLGSRLVIDMSVESRCNRPVEPHRFGVVGLRRVHRVYAG